MERHNGSFLGVNTSGFCHPNMAASRTPIGFADTATPYFPTGPTFGTRATTVSGGSRKSARLHQRMGDLWFGSWMNQDRSSFLFFRRATQLRRELYDILGVYKYTWLARLHGGSSAAQMKLEAQPWINDFPKSAVLDIFLLSCRFLDFEELSYPSDVFRLFGSGLSFYSVRFAASCFFFLGRAGDDFCRISSCRSPRSVSGLVLEIGSLICGTGHISAVFGLGLSGFWRIPCYFPSPSCRSPPVGEPGAIWVN